MHDKIIEVTTEVFERPSARTKRKTEMTKKNDTKTHGTTINRADIPNETLLAGTVFREGKKKSGKKRNHLHTGPAEAVVQKKNIYIYHTSKYHNSGTQRLQQQKMSSCEHEDDSRTIIAFSFTQPCLVRLAYLKPVAAMDSATCELCHQTCVLTLRNKRALRFPAVRPQQQSAVTS